MTRALMLQGTVHVELAGGLVNVDGTVTGDVITAANSVTKKPVARCNG